MTKDEAIAYLTSVGESLGTQDNACTADPIWMVQERFEVGPIDEDWGDTDAVLWLCDGEVVGYSDDSDKAKAMEVRFQKHREHLIPEGYTRCPINWRWGNVQPFFTKDAAVSYRDSQGHRHAGKLRIYADSAYRNSEWKRMREALAALV